MNKELEKRYEKKLRQMRLWNKEQSWGKDILIKSIQILLNEVCKEKNEPAGTKYDEAVKELRRIKEIEDLQECFNKLHGVIDKHIPGVETEMP